MNLPTAIISPYPLAEEARLKGLIPRGNLLVVLFNGYGDAFLALPALREILRRHRQQEVLLACYADQVETIFHGLKLRFVSGNLDEGRLSTTPCVNELEFQQVVSFNAYYPNGFEQEVAEHFAGRPRFGFCDDKGRPIHLSSQASLHMRDQYFAVLGWKAAYCLADRQAHIPATALSQARKVIRGWSKEFGNLCYALHLDSLPEKMWPVEKWLVLVSHIWSRWRAWPVILGEENEQAAALIRSLPFARKLPAASGISTHIAAVALAKSFIGIDSLFAHVADSYDKPMVAMFGPSDSMLWGPKSSNASVIKSETDGQMCHIPTERCIEAVDSLFRFVRAEEAGRIKHSID